MLPQNNFDDYQKVKDVFIAALDIEPEKRRAFLAERQLDKKLFAEVESLLKAREEAGEFLNDISAADTIRDSIEKNDGFIGRKIGNYRIEREIGRGGMGVVFLATRQDFHQQVALKLIKRGMDSEQILERFRREREILAALNHPFVARRLDGGTTSEDAPFFVMEYVEGVPLDEHCRASQLPETQRLELFRKICEAVIFAHQKLVVHRDLKPSNILVTADGTPKLLDFGIAKLLNSTDASQTQTSHRVLTPAYASPEQMRGEAVDTTSDVYSLGKILAEILSNENVKRPQFSTIENQKTTAQKGNLDSDLENILAMALREDASRRYGSVEKFSEDIRRYLAGLPVSARKDTFSYRAAKFFRRNKLSAAVSALFVLTLLGGLLTTLWQWREAQRERAVAERRFNDLRAVSDSFITKVHGAIENLPGSLPARQMLMRHAVEQLDALALESADNPALQDELARAYYNSAMLPDMLLVEKDLTLKKEIAIYRQLISQNPANIHYQEQLALGELALGDITKVRGSVAGALELYETGVAGLEKTVAAEPNSIEHRMNLAYAFLDTASIYILKEDIESAARMNRQTLAAIEEIKKLNAVAPELTALDERTQMLISAVETRTGDYKPAIARLRRMLDDYEMRLAKNDSDTRVNYFLWIFNRRLADALDRSGDYRTASKHLQAALSLIEKLLEASPRDFGYHRNSAATHVIYGKILIRQKQPAAALEHFRRAAELSEYVLASDTDNSESKTDLARANANIGNALVLIGRDKEGTEYLQKAVESLRGIYARDSENAELKRDYFQLLDWLSAASTVNRSASHIASDSR